MTEPTPDPEAIDGPPRVAPGWLVDTVTVLAYSMVLLAGVLLGLLGAFEIAGRPEVFGVRWPLAVGIAIVGNLGLGLLAGWGLQGRAGAVAAFAGWLIGVGIVMFGGTNDVVVGGAPGDWVPLGFLAAGSAAGVVAVALSARFSRPLRGRAGAPPPSGHGRRSSLRAPVRR